MRTVAKLLLLALSIVGSGAACSPNSGGGTSPGELAGSGGHAGAGSGVLAEAGDGGGDAAPLGAGGAPQVDGGEPLEAGLDGGAPLEAGLDGGAPEASDGSPADRDAGVDAHVSKRYWDIVDDEQSWRGHPYVLFGDESRIVMPHGAALNVYDVDSATKTKTLDLPSQEDVTRMNGDASGSRLLVERFSGVQLFDVETGKLLPILGYLGRANNARLMPSGEQVLATLYLPPQPPLYPSGEVKEACLIRVSSGAIDKELRWTARSESVTLIGTDEQGSRLLAFDQSPSVVVVWDMVKDALINEVPIPQSASLAGYSPDASVLVFKTDTAIAFVRADDGSQLGLVSGRTPAVDVAISHDGQRFATQFMDSNGALTAPAVFDISTGALRYTLAADSPDAGPTVLPFVDYRFSADDSLVFARFGASQSRSAIRVWERPKSD